MNTVWLLLWLSSVTPTQVQISSQAVYQDVAPMLRSVMDHIEDYDSYRIIDLNQYYKFTSDLSILLEKNQ